MSVNLSIFAGAGAQFLDNAGNVLTGGKIFSYLAGTTTSEPTYTDVTGTIAHTNPIILDASGRVPSGGEIWLTEAISYKFILRDTNDVLIATYDNITGNNSGVNTFIANLANTSDPTKGDALVGFRQSNSTGNLVGAVGRTVHQKLQESVSVLDFGADNTGATNTTAAINTALSSGAKLVHFPTGTYRIDATVVVPKDVSIFGDGAGATIFNASQAVEANIIDNAHITSPIATYVALPALAVNAQKNDRTLTFVSPPSVQPGDVIVIYNPTDFSWSGFRSYYRAGEYIRVASVTGNVIELQGSLCDSYITTAVTVYRVDNMTTCHWSGFTLIGKPTSSSPLSGIQLKSAKDSSLEDIRVTRATYIGIGVNLCFNVQLRQCTAEEDFAPSFGGEYGLAISNSHIVNVSGGYYCSQRHGITIGGGTGIGRVSNRYLTITGATISSTGAAQAADIHGNAEYVTYADCMIDGGVAGFGGDYQTLDNCQIRGKQTNGPCSILFSETRGLNFRITNCTIQNDQTALNRGALIDLGGNSNVLSASTYKGGSLVIDNNTMIWDYSLIPTVPAAPITIRNRGYVGTEPIFVFINNNKINCAQQIRNDGLLVDNVTAGGKPFEEIQVNGNQLYGTTVRIRGTPIGSKYVAQKVMVQNNFVFRGSTGIEVNNVKNIVIQNNLIRNVTIQSIFASGLSNSDFADVIHVSNNTIVDSPKVGTASTFTNRIIMAWRATNAYINGNIGGYAGETINVSTAAGFLEGETITGSSSGATAVVEATNGPRIGIGLTRVGTFSVGETITGSVSGATATVSSVALSANEFGSYSNVTNLYRGQNTNTGPGLQDQLDIVTNDKFQFIAPAYTTTTRNALAAPFRGQIIVNTTTGKLNFYTGTGWEEVTST